MSVVAVNPNQHRAGPRPRVPAPNKFIAKRLTQAGRDLVQALVFDGIPLTSIHEHLGISRSWARALAASPPVIAHMHEQLDVRRKAERPRNFHRLTELRDQDDNKAAAVSAIKVLEQIEDSRASGGHGERVVTPGYVIQVNVNSQDGGPNPGRYRGATVEATANPLISQADDVNDQLTSDDEVVLWIDGRGEGEG